MTGRIELLRTVLTSRIENFEIIVRAQLDVFGEKIEAMRFQIEAMRSHNDAVRSELSVHRRVLGSVLAVSASNTAILVRLLYQ